MKSLISKVNKKEALLILFITVMGYGVALSYEVGYSIYFSYDTEFIQVDIKSIYNGILNTSVFILLYASLFFTLKQKKHVDINEIDTNNNIHLIANDVFLSSVNKRILYKYRYINIIFYIYHWIYPHISLYSKKR